jgi:OFA family oxalate/formate antiporter-like MFS transporter
LNKSRLFYGWYIVLAGLVLTTYYSAVFTYGWTSFVTPILATFGWSVTQLSLASTLRGIESGVFNPLWGVAIDRWPLRRLMIIGVFFSALGIFIISQASNLWMYYAGFLVMGIAASSATSMIPNTAISRWFRKDVGKANGLFYVGMGLGGVLVPLLTFLIDKFGWRETLLYAAIGMLVIGLPLSLVFRNRPEEHGLEPDGRNIETNTAFSKASQDNDTEMRQVFKMRAFWYLNVVVLFQSAVLGIMSLYCMPYMEDLGISRTSASFIISLFTIISVCVRMPMGMLGDVFRKKYMIAFTLGMVGLSLLLFWLFNSRTPFWLTVMFAVFYGVGIAGIMPLRMPILAEYFGRKNMGKLFGVISIPSMIGGVAAVPLAGMVFDSMHSYKPVLLALAGFSLVSVLLMLIMPPPRKSLSG